MGFPVDNWLKTVDNYGQGGDFCEKRAGFWWKKAGFLPSMCG
jgi:hypothetical protein